MSTCLNISCPSDLDISIRGSIVARACVTCARCHICVRSRYTETIRGPKEHASELPFNQSTSTRKHFEIMKKKDRKRENKRERER